MNDWLDYKGSGSSRAYAGNVLAHAFRDNVKNTVKADSLKFQNQCAELRSKVYKCFDGAAEMNRKMEQANKLHLQRYDYKGNPKAESAIDSARRNISNEITRLYDKLHKERKSLASEYNQLQATRNEYEKNGIKIPEQTIRYMSDMETTLSSMEYYIDTQYKIYRDALTT